MRSEVYGVSITKAPATQDQAQGGNNPLLTYDSKLTKNLARLRSEIAQIKRRINRYGKPVSQDNFI